MLTAKEKLRSILKNKVSNSNLFFKWAPREKSAKKKDAKDLRNVLKMTTREYRRLLSSNTTVVEQSMCAKMWDEINFSHVPSLASARYQKAFERNSPEKYSEYIRELQKPSDERDPKVRVNSGAIYPYDVVKSLRQGNKAVADAQFEALPDFVGDAKIFPMVDVSGSMQTQVASGITALDIAVSLGLYLSDRTSSDFKNMFLTFSNDPKIQVLKGSLSQKYTQLCRADWGFNTNLHVAFSELLRVAKKGQVSAENMPDTLLVLSDMQFDRCARYDDSAMEMIKRKYHEAGYKMPQIVFWNLAARESAKQSPVKMNENGVAIVSGFSPAIMTSVLGADPEEFTPYNMMLRTIMSERYAF